MRDGTVTSLVSDIISLGGLALQQEDKALGEIYRSRGLKGGILNTELEHFYRFIFWRGIVAKYDSSIRFKHAEGYVPDLLVKHGDLEYFFEMKYWKEEHSKRPKSDVEKLGRYQDGGYLVLFSANPSSKTEENLKIIDSVFGIRNREGVHQFSTQNSKGNDIEFWVGAWHVPSRNSVSLNISSASS